MSLFEPKFKETDFMSELEAATHMRPATSATLMLFSIIILVLLALIWAGVTQVEQLTRGRGSSRSIIKCAIRSELGRRYC